ncbi:peptidoglycan recognition protein family protein [Streptomyces sp. NBC_01320]|uniref:peptidoglycan recognition protein family protein n=1 Tax=Streptomyces sp. NBC_01320 TaxID=2903824 RepID=UPI002E137B29|nr:peptidoglycan recognition protein family protein [Streptomyces sp. NBC_01320]
MKLVTRAQLGWPASAAPTQATAKGVKVHYEGAPVSTKLLTDHQACISQWKAIRASHLANKTENYSDVAYNYAACPHGYLLEGRGLGKRTGANGNQPLNVAHYAVVGLVGSSGLTEPTDAMLGAIRDGIELLRAHGAGAEIKGHRDGYATACPGGPLYTWVQNGAPRPKSEEDDPMAGLTKLDIFNAVWKTDAIAAPSDATDIKTNPNWQALSVLRDTQARVRSMDKRVAAMSAAITALAGQVGKGAGTSTIVAAVEAAIEHAVIDVNINTKEA